MEAKKKYFMDCHLAGRQYHDADEVWDKLKVGTVLQLVLDTDNRHDPNAVAVVYHDKELDDDFCMGYVPRTVNETIASFLEMGWNDIFECRISKIKEDAHPEYQIYLTIKIKRNKMNTNNINCMEHHELKILDIGKGRSIRLPLNYQHFILDSSSNPENKGWDKETVMHILKCIQEGHIEDLDMDDKMMNDIGTFFEDGVCVKPNIEMAVYWYEQAIENGNDLARSNLADILRKGTQGYPKDMKRAFELYSECGLPYAHYRVGEFLEHGWGVPKDLEAAKAYYRQAYKEGRGLANKKLKE